MHRTHLLFSVCQVFFFAWFMDLGISLIFRVVQAAVKVIRFVYMAGFSLANCDVILQMHPQPQLPVFLSFCLLSPGGHLEN